MKGRKSGPAPVKPVKMTAGAGSGPGRLQKIKGMKLPKAPKD